MRHRTAGSRETPRTSRCVRLPKPRIGIRTQVDGVVELVDRNEREAMAWCAGRKARQALCTSSRRSSSGARNGNRIGDVSGHTATGDDVVSPSPVSDETFRLPRPRSPTRTGSQDRHVHLTGCGRRSSCISSPGATTPVAPITHSCTTASAPIRPITIESVTVARSPTTAPGKTTLRRTIAPVADSRARPDEAVLDHGSFVHRGVLVHCERTDRCVVFPDNTSRLACRYSSGWPVSIQ